MYIVVEHEIEDPESFWKTAESGLENLPPGLTLHHALPNSEGTRAACLWEGDGVDQVKNFLEPEVGSYSKNEYFAVETENAIGLSRAVQT